MNGILIIDKPSGITSHDVVQRIRRITKIKKVGHAGTLDPLATGVLPILVGSATKLSDQIMGGVKEYVTTVKFGESTDTDDAEGKVLTTKPVPEDLRSELEKVMHKFKGIIRQTPPNFSAIKQNGRCSYKLARKGLEVKLESREVEVKELEVLEVNPPTAIFRVKCSKGTYIRALARDIGEAIGCCGHVQTLRRTICSGYNVKDSTELTKIFTLQDVVNVLRPPHL